jgi:hypothetical protein
MANVNQPSVNPNLNEMCDTLAVCGIDVATANRVIDVNGDGVDSLQLFAVLTGKDVETMIYNAGRCQVNQGGYCLGAIQAKGLKALNWWVRARIREQEEVNRYGVEWTIAACQEAMLLMDIERTTRERSSSATMPEKFNPDFDQAVNYMSGQIARIFTKSYEASTKRKRQISGVDTEGRGRGRGSGCGGRGPYGGRYGGGRGGRGGRGGAGNGTSMMNGVDVADVTRSFSDDNWHKLGDAGRQYVNAERARNRGSGNDDNCIVSDVNTGGAGKNANNAGDNTATGITNGNRGSQNGTRFGANGGRGRGGRNASALTSCICRINRVSKTEIKNETVAGFVGRNEMDSHADTSCTGANWKAIKLTGLTCDVSPFTQDYDAVKDVGDDVLKKRINEFEETLEEQLDNENFQSEEVDVDFYLEDVEIAEDDANTPTDEEYGDMIQEEKKDHVDEFDNDVYDRYLGAELNINRGDGEIRGRVVKRARGNNGEFIGRSHNNLLIDSREIGLTFRMETRRSMRQMLLPRISIRRLIIVRMQRRFQRMMASSSRRAETGRRREPHADGNSVGSGRTKRRIGLS